MKTRQSSSPTRIRRSRTTPFVVAILSAVPLALLSPVSAGASPVARESVDGRVTTVVRDAATGAPVPGVTVHAISAEDRFADLWDSRAGSDASGVATFEGLLPGQYSFFVVPFDGVHGHASGRADAVPAS